MVRIVRLSLISMAILLWFYREQGQKGQNLKINLGIYFYINRQCSWLLYLIFENKVFIFLPRFISDLRIHSFKFFSSRTGQNYIMWSNRIQPDYYFCTLHRINNQLFIKRWRWLYNFMTYTNKSCAVRHTKYNILYNIIYIYHIYLLLYALSTYLSHPTFKHCFPLIIYRCFLLHLHTSA